jgi:hypothetical protein
MMHCCSETWSTLRGGIPGEGEGPLAQVCLQQPPRRATPMADFNLHEALQHNTARNGTPDSLGGPGDGQSLVYVRIRPSPTP